MFKLNSTVLWFSRRAVTLGALCLVGVAAVGGAAWAQTVPKEKVKAKAGAPELGQIPVIFSVSTSGDGSALGGSGDYLPSGASVSPQDKNYYVTLTASVTVPLDVNASFLPDSLHLKARRVRNQLLPTGAQQRFYTGDELGNLPVLNRLPNTTENQYGRTYTYSTFEQNNHEDLEQHEARRVSSDWNVSKVLGRWELRVRPEDGASNAVDVKIDKRTQIINTALDWATYWPNRPESSKKYGEIGDGQGGTERILNEAVYIDSNTGEELFTQCHSFAGYVYNRHGLYDAYGGDVACSSLPSAATADDSGSGSLRFFSAHTGVIIGQGILYGGQMVDINNPEAGEGGKGLSTHSWTFGGTLDDRPNRTLPDPSGAKDPNNPLLPKSWLQTLDEE